MDWTIPTPDSLAGITDIRSNILAFSGTTQSTSILVGSNGASTASDLRLDHLAIRISEKDYQPHYRLSRIPTRVLRTFHRQIHLTITSRVV